MTGFIPIFMPPPPPEKRDCIVVDSKVYCKDDAVSNKEMGITILVLIVAVLYIIFIFRLATEIYDNGWIIIGGIFGPILLIALYLLLT